MCEARGTANRRSDMWLAVQGVAIRGVLAICREQSEAQGAALPGIVQAESPSCISRRKLPKWPATEHLFQ